MNSMGGGRKQSSVGTMELFGTGELVLKIVEIGSGYMGKHLLMTGIVCVARSFCYRDK